MTCQGFALPALVHNAEDVADLELRQSSLSECVAHSVISFLIRNTPVECMRSVHNEGLDVEPEEIKIDDSSPFIPSWSTKEVYPNFDWHPSFPGRAVILFDWDDTLCPTSAMKDLGLRSNVSAKSLISTCYELRELSYAVEALLRIALQLADRVLIVTNAKEGWVETSCTAWMPTLSPTLTRCEIVSARSRWEPLGFTCPVDWKMLAFSEIIGRLDAGCEPWQHVVSVGDARYEREALLGVVAAAPVKPRVCRAKVVKLNNLPSTQVLLKEVRAISLRFQQIVEFDGDLDLEFDGVGFLPKAKPAKSTFFGGFSCSTFSGKYA